MPLSARLLFILVLLGACGRATHDPGGFEPEIRAFEASDRSMPPQPGGVVFIGSSSIKNWTNLAADFPGVPVLNRGFGGSTLPDVVHYEDRIVLRYRPRLVVLYAGDNDLAEGRTPAQVVADYRALVARLRSALPATRLVYISIKPSPSRRQFIALAREANQRIRTDIAGDSLANYVDVFTPMLNAAGEPRPELFVADSLHLSRAGYLLWRSLLQPLVSSSEHVSSSGLTGRWTIVGHRIPGVSAMTDAKAAAWHGRTLLLSANEATSGKDHCAQPKYAARTAERDRFLAEEFKLQPGSLAPLATRPRLSILEVSCRGAPWPVMGGRLIEIDADHALAPWDGVFFELTRVPDWQVSLRGVGPVRFGMSMAELERALGGNLSTVSRTECTYVNSPGLPQGLKLMVDSGRVVRAEVHTAGIRTDSGAEVGITESQIRRMYPGVRTEPHKYTGPEGHYLIVRGEAADSGSRFIFETDGRVVTQYRAGLRPQVDYVEGCS
jgi:lysophospholipase L1-like esterase